MTTLILFINLQLGQELKERGCFCSTGVAQKLGARIIWKLTHIFAGWWLAVDRAFSRSYGWKTYTWPFHVAVWLPHSLVAGFQGLVSQENQAEAVLHFMTWSWKSHNITSIVVKSLPGFKEREYKSHFLAKRCPCHFIGRAHKVVCIAVVIFGKYKLPQIRNGKSFRIGYLEPMTLLSKDLSKDHMYQ